MNYVEMFLEENKAKPFVTNLEKYTELDYYGKAKVISSMLTHFFIDAEHGRDNKAYIDELVSVLNEFVFYKLDNFLSWIEQKIK